MESDCERGFLLDGFPRTLDQGAALDESLNNMDISLDKVVNIEVDIDILIGRAIGRRICKDCGATYHVEFNPPKIEGKCDLCSGELYQRDDDTEETVKKRFTVYQDQTKPLIDYYMEKDLIFKYRWF